MSIFAPKTFLLVFPAIAALTAELSAVQALVGRYDALTHEKETVDAEIAAFIQGNDSDDEATLQKIAVKKVRSEMLPNIISRVETEARQSIQALHVALLNFEREMASAGAAERDAILDKIEAAIRPFAPSYKAGEKVVNPARQAAMGLPVVCSIPVAVGCFVGPLLIGSNGSGTLASQAAEPINRAQALLAIREDAHTRKTFIPREIVAEAPGLGMIA